nr:immunoglobulin heavy chain junction region [Mus musculus]
CAGDRWGYWYFDVW